jgi:hypothetical protein
MTDRPDLDALAAAPLDDADERLLARIAAVVEATDPVPEGLAERIQFQLTLEALQAEVAELQRWGADAVGARSGNDSPTMAQTITFTSSSLTTMITITDGSHDHARIDGWVAGGAGVAVELRTAGTGRHTVADADGRFAFDDVPRGLVQFLLRPSDPQAHPPVITPSLQL